MGLSTDAYSQSFRRSLNRSTLNGTFRFTLGERTIGVVSDGPAKAGGATVAKVLCDSQFKVIALEAGPQIEAEEFVQEEWTSYRTLSWNDERIAAGS